MQAWKFYFITFGCKVNQYETQSLREAWQARGGVECDDPAQADVVCVNSCAITARGERDARNAVFRLRRAAPAARLILTGCAARLFEDFRQHGHEDCVQPDLPEGKGTVCVDIHSSHLAPTPVGMTVRATATVTGVSENGKLITFRVEASDDWGPIGEGTHTRAIIANDRFLQKCTSKLTERK